MGNQESSTQGKTGGFIQHAVIARDVLGQVAQERIVQLLDALGQAAALDPGL